MPEQKDLETKVDQEPSNHPLRDGTYLDENGQYVSERFPTVAKMYNAWVRFSDLVLGGLGYGYNENKK